MRVSELEKEAFLFQAAKAVGSGLARVGAGALNMGAKVAKPLATRYSTTMGKNPVGTLMNTAMGYMGAKDVWHTASGGAYTDKLQGLGGSQPKYFGQGGMTSFAEERMDKIAYSHPFEALKEIAGLGTEFSLPRLIAATAVPLTVGTILAPSIKTVGEKVHHELFPVNERINAEDELAKHRLKMMGEYDTKQLLREKEKHKKEQTVLPAMTSIVDHLKQHDPHIRAAWEDESIRPIIGQTMNTVYAFAPDIAKDHRAMQSILREAVSSPDGGLSFQTIKHISEAQKFITNGKGEK